MLPSRSAGIENNFISEPIKLLLSGSDKSDLKLSGDLSKYFLSDLTYNWTEIRNLFPSNIRDDQTLTYQYCSDCVSKLRPIWISSENNLKKALSNKSVLLSHLKWTGQEKHILHFINGPKRTTTILENVLLLTSIIENAVGNVFFTVTNRTPPHLLRDLLNTKELTGIFGSVPIIFLKILLGTPNSVNLRNIVWHGFPSTNDISSYYVGVLITLMMSLSKILNESKMQIVRRKMISNSRSYFGNLEISMDEHAITKEIISLNNLQNGNSVIPDSHVPIWNGIYELYRIEDYQPFILLILAELEFVLRVKYGILNQLDVSAKIDEYYIILDTILEETVGNDATRSNTIYEVLNMGSLKLIYDIFVSPFGPRIRDKISHGEVDLSTIDKKICSILLYLSFSIIYKDFQLSNYESSYHLNCILYEKIKMTKFNLEKLKSIKIPEILKNKLDWNTTDKTPNRIRPSNQISGYSDQIKIFHRPTKEAEVVLQSIKIIKLLNLSCTNSIESFHERFAMFAEKSLRSKRRETLNKMLETLPKTWIFLRDVCKIIENIFYKLQEDGEHFLSENYERLLKCLKQILKLVENLSKYCNKSNNEWERAEKLYLNFNQIFEKYEKILC